jgi:hypothetical protein
MSEKTVRDLYNELCTKTDITYDDFEKLVLDKVALMDGLCDTKTAVSLVLHDQGIEHVTKKTPDVPGNREEKFITYTQTYDIRTKVGAEVDSKGNIKPAAQVEITRKLVDGEEVYDLVHADMQRGLEEVQQAIQEVLSRGGQ